MVGLVSVLMNNSLSESNPKTINMDSNNHIYDYYFTDKNLKSINICLIIIFPVLPMHKSILFCNGNSKSSIKYSSELVWNLYFKHSTTH